MQNWKFRKIQELRAKLSRGEGSIGGWQQINNGEISEILAMGDYDWITLDWEHGRFTENGLVECVKAHEVYRKLSLIRIPELSPQNCKICIEVGASGAIIPMVETPSQASFAIQLLRWPPNGARGVGYSRANGFGEFFDLSLELNRDPFIVFMIETMKGVDNLDKILEENVPDAVFIGPYDLSASLGIVGQFENELFINSLDKIKQTCSKHSVPCGLHVIENDISDLEKQIGRGFKFLAFSMDTVQLRQTLYKAGGLK